MDTEELGLGGLDSLMEKSQHPGSSVCLFYTSSFHTSSCYDTLTQFLMLW